MIRRPPRSTLSLHDALPIWLPSPGFRAFTVLASRRWRKPAASGPETSTSSRSRSEEHTSELQSQSNLVCRLLLEKKKHPELRVVSCEPGSLDRVIECASRR